MKLEDLKEITSRMKIDRDYLHMQEVMISLGLDPDRIYQELEMTSRFADTHRDTSFSNSAVSLHSHSFYELLCCRNTCGVEYLVGTERYRLQRGDIVIVPPEVSHRPLLPENMQEPYRRDVLWISQEFVGMLQQRFPLTARVLDHTRLIRTAGTEWESLLDNFRRGVKEAESRLPGWEEAVAANTMLLLIHLRRAVEGEAALQLRAEKPELMDQVLAYVERNLPEKISLGNVARHFYVSESTVSQTFRKKMGVSFYRCVSQRRLIAAKALIQEGIPLDAAARQVGFADYSGFYRAFKKEYGISPRQFRKLQLGQE